MAAAWRVDWAATAHSPGGIRVNQQQFGQAAQSVDHWQVDRHHCHIPDPQQR